ncbi:MAG: UDP-N-acetylmuramoyl-L-alanyl-D-glutamate--2,6-diaminopimelate ligase [Holosporales bacterium]|nr:UDP-N-acetylmuramoyl-L-alanyl-D-glutamate--2,6-diaminopimelate ligase [Holosporales bacterium]
MGIKLDSRLVERGDIFVGIKCANTIVNVEEAITRGASVVFAEGEDCEIFSRHNVVAVSDARMTASILAKLKYSAQPECCVAVTGTQGKSSVVHFLRQIWIANGLPAASLGTVGLYVNNLPYVPHDMKIPNLTTPDPVTIHKVMNHLAGCGISRVAFEASSHGIDQKRLHSVTLTAAAFTNFSSDHLDYHKDRDAYLSAKLKLFQEVLPCDGVIAAPYDDPELCNRLIDIGKKVTTFGFSGGGDVTAENISISLKRTMFDVVCNGEKFDNVTTNLFGKLQIANLLCAATLAHASGIDMSNIVNAISGITALSGRMEHVTAFNGGDVYIDYAHTTESFKCALTDFKNICAGRLVCVFGCGGDRDKTKRRQMGAIASEIADITIVTDDNPRSEDPAAIRAAIVSAAKGAIEIGDRAEAISYAVSLIKKGDIVVIIGKGHESYQIYGSNAIKFNDRDEALKACNLSS